MDMGLSRLQNAIVEMASLAQESVMKAIQAYTKGERITQEALKRANELSTLAAEVDELAVELLARYQPVATDLRFIKSCLEIAYGFSRFGRYAWDIAQVLDIYGDLSDCDKSLVQDLSVKVSKMIETSIESFKTKDTKLARSLRLEDDQVDKIYMDYNKQLAAGRSKPTSIKCALTSLLVLRYLERIADHACYIADSVIYITTATKV
jgi:phosphate transport system protein